MRQLLRWLAAGALAAAACASAALGAELLDGADAVTTSSPPALLGPITESGRTGWDCAPERAATARTATAAGLPHD